MRHSSSDVGVNASAELARAEKFLANRGLKFTPLRRSVLELLYIRRKAIGAYDLAASFEKKYGRSVVPNSIYRTLDFLEEQGLVVHLASTRTYAARVIRENNKLAETSLFFVCKKCGRTIECHESRIGSAIRRSADAIGFVTRMRAVDLEGICRECSSKLDGKTKRSVS